MQALLAVSAIIDRVLAAFGRAGAWAGFLLVVVVCYDVVTRYFGVPKPFGLNSTQIQESEYWLHAYLFSLVIGYAYIKQAHVRIDLIRDRVALKSKFLIEILGCLFFCIPYAILTAYLSVGYFMQSYSSGEASKSVIGLSHIWLLKISMPIMFTLLALAGISVLFKAIAGYAGALPDEMVAETVSSDH